MKRLTKKPIHIPSLVTNAHIYLTKYQVDNTAALVVKGLNGEPIANLSTNFSCDSSIPPATETTFYVRKDSFYKEVAEACFETGLFTLLSTEMYKCGFKPMEIELWGIKDVNN